MEVMKMIKSPCYWLPETEFLFILCGLVGCVCYRAWVHMQLIAFSRIFFTLYFFCCSNSDYKLTGFKTREVHYLSVLEVRSLESVSLGCIPSGSSRRKSFGLPFLASRSHLHFLAHGPFLHHQNQKHSIFKSLSLFLPPFKDPYSYIRPTTKSL